MDKNNFVTRKIKHNLETHFFFKKKECCILSRSHYHLSFSRELSKGFSVERREHFLLDYMGFEGSSTKLLLMHGSWAKAVTEWALLSLWCKWLLLVCCSLFYFVTSIFIKLTARSELIYQYVEHLTQAVESYKQRMDWLTSKSRQVFGVIVEQSITIVLDFGGMLEEELDLCRDALIMVLKEQVAYIAKFNIIWWVPIGKEYVPNAS